MRTTSESGRGKGDGERYRYAGTYDSNWSSKCIYKESTGPAGPSSMSLSAERAVVTPAWLIFGKRRVGSNLPVDSTLQSS